MSDYVFRYIIFGISRWFILGAAILLFTGCGKDSDEVPTLNTSEVYDITVPEGFVIEQVAEGLKFPTSIAYPPDGSDRMFVNELQSGRIRIIQDGTAGRNSQWCGSPDRESGFRTGWKAICFFQ